MDYRSKIYDILNKQRSHMLQSLEQPTMLFRAPAGDKPILHGGIRVMDHPLPGYFLPKDPASLATGSNVGSMRPTDQKQEMRRYIDANDLDEDPEMEGGRVNWKKVGKSIKKVAVPLLKDVGKEVKKQVIPAVTKYGLKAAKDYLLPAAEMVAENPEILLAAAGRKSKKNHKVHRQIYSDSDSDEEGSIHIDVNSHKGESGGRRPNARAQIVKKVMSSKGLSMCAASKYVKDHGLYKK